MIDPTIKDIGRSVIYHAHHPGARREPGVITSFNAHYVFVRFGVLNRAGYACRREDLEWEHPAVEAALKGGH